jgi:hypothetical protein
MWCSFEKLEMTQLTMAEYPTRFTSSSNMLVPLYQFTWHHVPDICKLDTHNGDKLNLIYVKNVIYKQHFHQLKLYDMCLSIVENQTLPPRHSWTIKITAVNSQWLHKSVWTIIPQCSLYYKLTATNLVKKFPTFMENKDPLPYCHIIIF